MDSLDNFRTFASENKLRNNPVSLEIYWDRRTRTMYGLAVEPVVSAKTSSFETKEGLTTNRRRQQGMDAEACPGSVY